MFLLNKKRVLYIILIVITIPLGLATRYYADNFPLLIQQYGGDALSATCIFFGIRFLFISKKLISVGCISYLICIIIECLQLYQAPWIVKLRHTPPFGILLGYGFLWSDWLCYAAGVLLGIAVAIFFEKGLVKFLK